MEKTEAPNSRLLHAELTEKVIGVFYELYHDLGYGFLESVYENILALALSEAGLNVARQKLSAVWYRGTQVGGKSAKAIDLSFEKQALNYLKAIPIEVALILNFGPKPQVRRLIFESTRKDGLRNVFPSKNPCYLGYPRETDFVF